MKQNSTEETLSYLNSLISTGIKLGLRNISSILRELGDPQLKIPAIHIAGTNGKGSTAAFTESILRAAGYKVGLYTSPHLTHFSERIQINRHSIPESRLEDLIIRIRKVVEEQNIPTSFFEFGTAMAFLYFAEQETDINVIEVGLGGRLDATRLCAGTVSILTSISLDHTSYLGNTVQQIAFEKASIIKEGGTVFAAIGDGKGTLDVISKSAREKSAKVNLLGEDFRVKRAGQSTSSQTITFIDDEYCFEELHLPLLGDHQADNAALAIAACLHQVQSKGRELSEQSIRTGLESTRWDGRLEVISTHPTVILDCAHNTDAVKKLTASARKLFSYARVILVLGMMKDKPTGEMLEILSGFGDLFFLVRPNQVRSE
ncbi:MAG TPA: folylpolyglutamate synthase/dihydrofolate synthase family protein, partial [Nitrospinaceae bacterium]|nr:folylpolyglutamate synthase/dihydrofolate synthase family protein [Nitrospinaceae bacterium]